jgi:hypothetical protein
MSISNSKIIINNFYDYSDNISEITDEDYQQINNITISVCRDKPQKIHKKLNKYVNKLLSIRQKNKIYLEQDIWLKSSI